METMDMSTQCNVPEQNRSFLKTLQKMSSDLGSGQLAMGELGDRSECIDTTGHDKKWVDALIAATLEGRV
jgi:hypothetical protein